MTLKQDAVRWLAEARAAEVVDVVASRGSVPREAGARLLVAADAVRGTIGGGHLEWQAIARARDRLARRVTHGDEAPAMQTLALGPSLGQCCGGEVVLRYAPLDAVALAPWPDAAPRFHLQLHGAGHVGRAIVALLGRIDCRVRWIDGREAEFAEALLLSGQGALPAHVDVVCVDAVEAEVAQAPPGACFLVLTHEHDLDLRITDAILRRGDFAYCGLIGSRTKRARFVHRLSERGVPAAALARLTCPIGVPGIVGKEPEVLALAVVAQLLQQQVPARPAGMRQLARSAAADEHGGRDRSGPDADRDRATAPGA